jgi:protein SCO1/2
MKLFPIKKILILVTILAVPGFLYYLLQDKGKNRYKPLPFFGPKVVANTFHRVRGKEIPDTIYHQVQNYQLQNQAGDSISLDAYKGKVVILSLFHTTGNTYGVDFTNKAVKAYLANYGDNEILRFVSISIDPTNDRPALLKDYARTISARAGKWDLLTGDSTQVFDLLNKQLFVDAHKVIENGKPKFIYSNMFVLLDTQRRIRGYYEATNQLALSKLDDEIRVLITEELRNMKDGR